MTDGRPAGQLTNAALAAWFGTCRYTENKESPGRAGAFKGSMTKHLEGEL